MISKISKSSMVNDSKKFLKSDLSKEMEKVTKNAVNGLVGD
jgi:hypothetical protein